MEKTKEGFTLWLTGLPCSGKSTLAAMIAAELGSRNRSIEVLDGDIVRRCLTKGLGFSREDRDENIRRIGFVSQLLSRHGVAVIVAAISPYRAVRDEIRASIGNFIEVYLRASVDTCIRRDVKGMYKKALAGELKHFTGIDDPYEPPLNAELILDTEMESPGESAAHILSWLQQSGLVAPLRLDVIPKGTDPTHKSRLVYSDVKT